jgi:3-(3-hydroxy-phenyl)propionate hydroxylase
MDVKMQSVPPTLKTYAFRRPPEMEGVQRKHPIVVVGAGPVGLTLALTLTQAGVPCVLLEDDERVCHGSRALGMSRRTLEIWQALGAADEIVAHGKPWDSGRSFYQGQTILHFQMQDDERLRHRPMFNIQQCYTEHYLVEALQRSPCADVRWQSKLESIFQDEHGVTINVRTPQGAYALQAEYVVACDGARSAVRSAMDLHLKGASYDATYVIADIELDKDLPMERRCWFDPPSNPGLTVLMHGQPDRLLRLDYQLAPHEDAEIEAQPERIKQRVQKHLDFIGEKGAWRLDWASPYRVHSRSLESFVHGRIAFAGDAAHLMPIFGIRGLNSGVEDAWNLGKKLVGVVKGQCAVEVLAAYDKERRAVFYENTALANRNAVFMTPDGNGSRLVRDAVLALALGPTQVKDILNPKQATYVPLRHSPLSTDDEETWSGGCAPGDVIADAAYGNGGFVQSDLPSAHTVLYFAEGVDDEVVADVTKALKKLTSGLSAQALEWRVIAKTSRGFECEWLDAQGVVQEQLAGSAGATYLVRDDHHVAARWKHFDPQKLQAALSRLLGYTPSAGVSESQFLPPEISQPEQVYRHLAEALNGIDPQNYTAFLTKLALKLGLEQCDSDTFVGALRTAAADLPSVE